MGAAIEAACLGAAAAGSPLRFVPAPDPAGPPVGWLVPAGRPADPADVALAAWLPLRHTARVAHRAQQVPVIVQVALQAEAARIGGRLYCVTDQPAIRRLAALAQRATAAAFADPAVHAEVWHWLRLDPAAPAYRRDGLTADCLGLSAGTHRLARWVLAPAVMRRLVGCGAHQLLAADTGRLVRRSACLCLLTLPGASPAPWIAGGRALLRGWLHVAAAGLTTHPISALLDCPATVGSACAAFAARAAHPAALFRLGATPRVAQAPRLPLDAFIEQEMPDAYHQF